MNMDFETDQDYLDFIAADEEEIDPELESLAMTPEGLGLEKENAE